MGLLVDGKWSDQWYDTKSTKGEFVRQASQFHCPMDLNSGEIRGDFIAESGRYHLFVSLACPWAHRTLIFRALKGLQPHIGVTVVEPDMLDQGWVLTKTLSDLDRAEGYSLSPVSDIEFLHQLYTHAQSDYSGRVTVPVLWDLQEQTIVCNESSEIIRLFNSAFDELSGVNSVQDYWPEALRAEIEAVNQPIYDHINNGVYKTGFATTQDAYERNFKALFNQLDSLEKRLSHQRYLVWDEQRNASVITEADWRLFTTLVRFDAVYVGHFKCNLKRIDDYPNLSGYLRELYQVTGVADTVNFEHIKRHYYYSHDTINPTRVVPLGPELDLLSPHGRDALK